MPIIVDGLANVRDLGGLERSDGSLTPTGVFLRSEMLDRLSASAWHALRGYGVRTVIDLRRENETTGDVPDDIRLVHVDLDGDEPDFWAPFEADGRGEPRFATSHTFTSCHTDLPKCSTRSQAHPMVQCSYTAQLAGTEPAWSQLSC